MNPELIVIWQLKRISPLNRMILCVARVLTRLIYIFFILILFMGPRNKIMLQVFLSYLLSFLISVWLFLLLKASNVTVETIAPANSIWNTVYFFVVIIVETIILIILLKLFKKFNLMKGIDLLISFFALFGIFSIFFEYIIWPLFISFLIIAIKEITKSRWLKNAIVFLVVGFFGAYIGYSLGLFPVFLLLVLIAIYDYIAVFKTKHMVFLANQVIDKNTLFVMDYGNINTNKNAQKLTQESKPIENKNIDPSKRNHLHLGTGDFALPLMTIMSLFAMNWIFGIIAFVACLISLELTIYLLFTKKHLALPAIPLQAIGFCIILLIYYLCVSL